MQQVPVDLQGLSSSLCSVQWAEALLTFLLCEWRMLKAGEQTEHCVEVSGSLDGPVQLVAGDFTGR